jgi:hypothetical protein
VELRLASENGAERLAQFAEMFILAVLPEVHMSLTERVTVSLSADLVEGIDWLEPNRSRFIAEAVARELARRRRERLATSLATPHADSISLVVAGLADWTTDLTTDDDALVDRDGGVAVSWIEGKGWLKEPA